MLVRHKSKYLPILIPILLLLLPRLLGLDRFLWKDELISLQTLKISVFENPLFFGTTTNLPLFFYLLRLLDTFFLAISSIFGLTAIPDYLYRILPIAFSVTGGYIAYLFIKRNVGKFASIAFLTLYAFSPLQIYYAQELRPYSLTQLLIILNIVYIHKLIKTREGNKPFAITSLLLILTHYSGYFYLLAEILILAALSLIDFRKRIVRTYLILPALSNICILFIGLMLSYFMMQNPLFYRSIGNLEVGTGWQPFKNPINEIIVLINRIKEVISLYYWFGIYYFSVDGLIQFFFKKLIMIVIAVGLFLSFKDRNKNLFNFMYSFYAIILILVSLGIAYLAEKFGYFPFGGRHIMPYSVILYMLISIALAQLNNYKKIGTIVLLVISILLLGYDYCLYFVLDFISIETLQGTFFKTCLNL